MKVTVNLRVNTDQNDLRKSLGMTWRDVICAGLSKGRVDDKVSFDPAIEDNLKQAVLYLQSAWKGIKAIK